MEGLGCGPDHYFAFIARKPLPDDNGGMFDSGSGRSSAGRGLIEHVQITHPGAFSGQGQEEPTPDTELGPRFLPEAGEGEGEGGEGAARRAEPAAGGKHERGGANANNKRKKKKRVVPQL